MTDTALVVTILLCALLALASAEAEDARKPQWPPPAAALEAP
jgi:hypothetical protein